MPCRKRRVSPVMIIMGRICWIEVELYRSETVWNGNIFEEETGMVKLSRFTG